VDEGVDEGVVSAVRVDREHDVYASLHEAPDGDEPDEVEVHGEDEDVAGARLLQEADPHLFVLFAGEIEEI